MSRLRTETETRKEDLETEKEHEKVAVQLQGLLETTKKSFEDFGDKLTEEEKTKASDALAGAEQKKDGSIEELKSALAELDSAARALQQAMLGG